MPVLPLLAIFVGGKSRRMGTPKGLLPLPDGTEPTLEALVRVGRQLGLQVALIGNAMPYRHLARGVARVDDDPPDGGPLAGLRAAARHALRTGHSHLVTVACDMPRLTAGALEQACRHPSDAAVLAPRRGADGPWEPMLARYDAARLADVLDEATVRKARSFQKLFTMLEMAALPVDPLVDAALRDWDTPADIGR
jgi:molybdopterin-guanine dinucleotide biosynthesis protein A